MGDRIPERNWQPRWVVLFIPPLALFVKDFVAINAILATEPGITQRAKFFFMVSQIPGTFFFNELNGMIVFNYLLAVLLGILWLFIASRRSRRGSSKRGVESEVR